MTRFQIASPLLIISVSSGLVASPSRAEPMKGYSVSLAAEAYEADSRSWNALLGLPLGKRGWAELSYGNAHTTVDSDADKHTSVDTNNLGAGAGVDLGRLELAFGYAYRKDREVLEQQDFTALAGYRGDRIAIGVDFFLREAQVETLTSLERRYRDPLAVQVTESLDGTGIGLHGQAELTGRFTVFASAMSYDYDSTSDDLPTLLSRTQLSSATRNQAFLDQALVAGFAYRLDTFTVTADVAHDRLLDTGQHVQTLTGRVDVPVGAHWLLSVWGGYSDPDDPPGVGFGGAMASISW